MAHRWGKLTVRFQCTVDATRQPSHPLARPYDSTLQIAEQSFGLQAELNRHGRNLARCCRVILEDLKRPAERCCRDRSLTTHDSRSHQESPAIDVARSTLQAICQAIDHRSDCSVLLMRRRR